MGTENLKIRIFRKGNIPYVIIVLGIFSLATFFCLGRQVEKHPAIFDRIKKEGHAVGNHTYSHLSGWTTGNKKYFEDVERADEIIGSRLFRPPYGRIRPSQIRVLKKKYRIVMWDVMSGDYDADQDPQDIVNVINMHSSAGSILVMHDQHLSLDLLQIALPAILTNIGFAFSMEALTIY